MNHLRCQTSSQHQGICRLHLFCVVLQLNNSAQSQTASHNWGRKLVILHALNHAPSSSIEGVSNTFSPSDWLGALESVFHHGSAVLVFKHVIQSQVPHI